MSRAWPPFPAIFPHRFCTTMRGARHPPRQAGYADATECRLHRASSTAPGHPPLCRGTTRPHVDIFPRLCERSAAISKHRKPSCEIAASSRHVGTPRDDKRKGFHRGPRHDNGTGGFAPRPPVLLHAPRRAGTSPAPTMTTLPHRKGGSLEAPPLYLATGQ